MPVSRISNVFAKANAENRAALVLYTMAGDPTPEVNQAVLEAAANGGADVLELGFPFSDPMADGPSIQKAALRSLANKTTLKKTLATAKAFREKNDKTALIMMGYLNPIENMGYDAFADAASDAGVDGMIVVDAPPEEDKELREALGKNDIALIRLATPTTDDKRLPKVLEDVSGFVYYVSVSGVTGVKSIDTNAISAKVAKVKAAANLPVAIGFGIKTEENARDTAKLADGIVIGSALVDIVFDTYNKGGNCAEAAFDFAQKIKAAAIK